MHQTLISLWLIMGLPSFLAGVILTLGAIYGRRLWRLRRYRQFVKDKNKLS
jgi:hypothetical protein